MRPLQADACKVWSAGRRSRANMFLIKLEKNGVKEAGEGDATAIFLDAVFTGGVGHLQAGVAEGAKQVIEESCIWPF